MEKFILLLLVFTFHSSQANPSDCGIDGNENDHLSFSVTNKRNDSGEWVTWFSAAKNTSGMTNNLDVVLVRSSTKCRGNHFVNIRGTIKDTTSTDLENKLFFHKRCSNNGVIVNNGRTLQTLKESGASALTNRPLLDDEVFTVRLDKMRNKSMPELTIGVTTHSPESIDLPDNMYSIKSGTWLFFHNHLYHGQSTIRDNFLKFSLRGGVKIGQTIGVMRSKFGALHFFLDGVDLGPAASKIPDTVYGAFQLFEDASEGTIIDT